MADFNADDILNAQADGAMETKYYPIPEGEWRAQVTKVAGRVAGAEKDKSIIDVMWEILDPAVIEATGLDRPTCRQSIFLDIENGRLALGKGKNVALGKLRDAVGQNTGAPWSPMMLQGCVAIVRTANRQDGDNTYTDVKSVAAA